MLRNSLILLSLCATFASCKKDYTCTCDVTELTVVEEPGVSTEFELSYQTQVTINDKEDEAKDQCTNLQTNDTQVMDSSGGGTETITTTSTCNIN